MLDNHSLPNIQLPPTRHLLQMNLCDSSNHLCSILGKTSHPFVYLIHVLQIQKLSIFPLCPAFTPILIKRITFPTHKNFLSQSQAQISPKLLFIAVPDPNSKYRILRALVFGIVLLLLFNCHPVQHAQALEQSTLTTYEEVINNGLLLLSWKSIHPFSISSQYKGTKLTIVSFEIYYTTLVPPPPYLRQ